MAKLKQHAPTRVDSLVMAKKRGAPVLLELLGGQVPPGVAQPPTPASVRPARAPAVSSPPPPAAPVVSSGMHIEPKADPASDRAVAQVFHAVRGRMPETARGPLAFLQRVPPIAWAAVAAAVVIVAILWAIAYGAGRSSTQREQQRQLIHAAGNPPVSPPLSMESPTISPALPAPGQAPAVPDPAPTAADQTPAAGPQPPLGGRLAGIDLTPDSSLQPGLNYLLCGIFKRASDAEQAETFLKSKGLPAKVVPAREFSSSASAEDRLVILQKGLDRDAYRQHGDRLKAEVQKLGRLWKAENRRAPTDFAQPYWDRYR